MTDYDWGPLEPEPCPECGETGELLQEEKKSMIVKRVGDGHVEEFVPYGEPEPVKIWCRECDTLIWEEE